MVNLLTVWVKKIESTNCHTFTQAVNNQATSFVQAVVWVIAKGMIITFGGIIS